MGEQHTRQREGELIALHLRVISSARLRVSPACEGEAARAREKAPAARTAGAKGSWGHSRPRHFTTRWRW